MPNSSEIEGLAAGEVLRRDIEDAVLEVARRPPGLRGPFIMDEQWLQRAAANVRRRRAAISAKAAP